MKEYRLRMYLVGSQESRPIIRTHLSLEYAEIQSLGSSRVFDRAH